MSVVTDTRFARARRLPLAGRFLRPEFARLRTSLTHGVASGLRAAIPAALSTLGLLGALTLGTLSTVAVPMAAAHTHVTVASLAVAESPARVHVLSAPRASRSRPVLATHTVTKDVVVGGAESGMASWYGDAFAGRRTSSGEVFRPSEMTAAHKFLPFGTRTRVCASWGNCIVVRITDRGPFVPGRIIDLSEGAARALGMGGIAYVTITPVELRTVVEPILSKPRTTPARASRSLARTRLIAGEAHPQRESVIARPSAASSVASRPVSSAIPAKPAGPAGPAAPAGPATALSSLVILGAFGAFRGKFCLEPDESLSLPEVA